ncbi:MAG: hypothetical protein JRJ84_23105, partial [Deltaproteobacteria bacterium]|nr:hypothetical protein [Deltaproteobacteria bacterium]
MLFAHHATVGAGLCLVLVAGSGCARAVGPRVSQYVAVWADDDSAQALVENSYRLVEQWTMEGWAPGGSTDHKYRLYTRDDTDGELVPIGKWRRGDPGHWYEFARPYYMKGAGYFLFDATEDDGDYIWWQVDPDGDYTQLFGIEADRFTCDDTGFGEPDSDCTVRKISPSPDGSILALVSHDPNPRAYLVDVQFIDAWSHAPLGAGTVEMDEIPETYEDGPVLQIDPFAHAQYTWTPAGDFLLSNLIRAWRVDPTGATTEVPLPGCTYPDTTSSDIAADGRTLWLGEPYEEDMEPFGCQYPE